MSTGSLKSILKDIANAIRDIWGWKGVPIKCQDFNQKIILIGKDVLAPVMIDATGLGVNVVKEITIGRTGSLGVNSISNNALENIKSLKKVTLNEGVTAIGSSAFNGCTGLTEIAIPSSIETIGTNPFSGCTKLEKITVSTGNNIYDSRGDCNAIIRKSDCALIAGCKGTVIPSDVKIISNSAFKLAGPVGVWEFPNGLETIGDQAFWGALFSEITIPDTVTSIAGGVFRTCTSLKTIEISTSSQLTSIGETAFFQCSKLESIYIPKGVSRIGVNTFGGCTVIKYYDFSDHTSVPVLDNINGISGNKGVAYIIVPDGLKEDWMVAENWSEYASRIVTKSEYEASQTA